MIREKLVERQVGSRNGICSRDVLNIFLLRRPQREALNVATLHSGGVKCL
jgi:hypothetical protein